MTAIREMYLICMGCKRIPEWTKITATKDSNGNVVKHYEFNGMCPYCRAGKFEVVEVRQKE